MFLNREWGASPKQIPAAETTPDAGWAGFSVGGRERVRCAFKESSQAYCQELECAGAGTWDRREAIGQLDRGH